MMWNRAELKMRGNMAFKKNYVSAVVVALLMESLAQSLANPVQDG